MAGGIAGGIGAGVGGLMSLGRQQFERRFTDVSYDLLISKTFYFFFYAAFGFVRFRHANMTFCDDCVNTLALHDSERTTFPPGHFCRKHSSRTVLPDDFRPHPGHFPDC